MTTLAPQARDLLKPCELNGISGEIVMVSFSESIYRGYRITAWAQSALEIADGKRPTRFMARAVVVGTAAAVMDYRLPVPKLDSLIFDQPAMARHRAEAAARAYIDELHQASSVEDSFDMNSARGYRRARVARGSSQAAA
jgi:hypothetical protein